MTKSNLSFRLAYYRNKHGYSQQDVAEKLNYSQQTIHKWENDQTKPDYQSLIKLADFYGVSLDELVGHEVKEKTSVYTNQELFLLDWVNSDEFNDISKPMRSVEKHGLNLLSNSRILLILF